jgi:glycosyltransferase involved in cell wall biosynthesis
VHLLIADTPDAFAAACVRLVQDEDLRARIIPAARQLQEDQYSLDMLKQRFALDTA